MSDLVVFIGIVMSEDVSHFGLVGMSKIEINVLSSVYTIWLPYLEPALLQVNTVSRCINIEYSRASLNTILVKP